MVQTLPIAAYRDQILAAVEEYSVVVITAETGAGKSTQVPQFLMEQGYQVVVTQPRRLAARTVAERVAEEVGCRLGGEVGFRTGFERQDGPETKVLFCTDGLQLVRELTGRGQKAGQTQVLVIDEVHEWNLNIEVLVAWVRKRRANGEDLKVVLMSATLDAPRLAAFYGDQVPVICVPGRLFPVEMREAASYQLTSTVEELVAQGRNVLVFQPGKKEILETVAALAHLNAEILPLHGDLDSGEQRRCFRHYGRPKVVVATNVAQTSITIDDIDAVVDSGLERRVELAEGIEGLYLKPISQADCKQRAGRAGRCKPGIYVLASEVKLAGRPEFPKAEIEWSRLDQLVLRLAEAGFDATELEFFHQPSREILADASRALHALGAIAEDGSVTKTGRLMAKLPVSVQFARMVVEAERLGVVDDVITIAALLEVGGIRDRTNAWAMLTDETGSDLLAELDIYRAAQGMHRDELRESGIFAKSFFRAKEVRGKLADAVRSHGVKPGSSGDRAAISKACVAGMVDHLYRREYGMSYRNGGGSRQLAKESVVTGCPQWVVGLPKDIDTRRGTLNLVAWVTKVDPSWLVEIAPQLVRAEVGLTPRYDASKDTVVSTGRIFFGGQMVEEREEADPEHECAASLFCAWLAAQMTV